MGDYRFVQIGGVGIMLLYYEGALPIRKQLQVWTRGRVRKPHTCRGCQQQIRKSYLAWLPVTHALNRGHRICDGCMALYSADATEQTLAGNACPVPIGV